MNKWGLILAFLLGSTGAFAGEVVDCKYKTQADVIEEITNSMTGSLWGVFL